MIWMRLWVVLWWALCMHGAHAIGLQVSEGLASQAVPAGIEYRPDPGGALTLDDVVQSPDAAWMRSASEVPTLGYSESAYWFRFSLSNTSRRPLATLLEVAYPVLNHLDVFVLRPDGIVNPAARLGSVVPVSQRPYPHRNFIVPIDLQGSEVVQIYLRVQTRSSIQVPVTVWSPTAFLIQDNVINILYGAYLGLVVIMFAYNLKLLLGTRDLSYFYYICWVTGMASFVVSLHGLSLQYLWPAQVRFNEHALVLLVTSIAASALLFCTHFLNMHVAMPERVQITRAVLWINGLAAMASFALPYSLMIRVAIVLTVVSTTFIGHMAIQRWVQGYRPARYFAISYALVLLGGVAMSLSKFGWIPRSVWTEHSLTLGSALEIVLLSLALADRHQGEAQARSKAQADLFEWQQKQHHTLEAKVALRTQELELANWQLQQYVNRMARLQTGSELGASLIHELRQPLAAIQSFAQGAVTMMRTALDTDRLERVLGRIVDTSQKGNAMLDRMRAFLVQGNDGFRPFDLHESVREALVWVGPTCQQQGVRVSVVGDTAPLWAQGDGVLAQQVIVNLLRNAVDALIDAGSPTRQITVTLFADNGFACCRIEDTGPGLSEEAHAQLFENCFTTKSHGMGIGLKLSRSIAREMRGDLTMERPAVGASFLLSIPILKHVVSGHCTS